MKKIVATPNIRLIFADQMHLYRLLSTFVRHHIKGRFFVYVSGSDFMAIAGPQPDSKVRGASALPA